MESRLWQGLFLTVTIAALLGLVAAGCGEAARSARSPAAAARLPRIELKGDADLDSDTYPGEADDDSNHVFGRVAGAADSSAAAALVARYYAAAAAMDGGVACGLMYSVMAESIAAEYGGGSGPSYMRGGSCAAVMKKLFEHLHSQLGATLRVAAVRVRGNLASTRLSFGRGRVADYLELRRERGKWRVDSLIGSEQPIYVE